MKAIYTTIEHNCRKEEDVYPPRTEQDTALYNFKKFWYSLTLISNNNPACTLYFKSEYAIRCERRRHYSSSSFFTIHPLSKLVAVYDLYLFFLYLFAILCKTVDIAFVRRTRLKTGMYNNFIIVISIIEALSWINIIFMCFRGVVLQQEKIIVIEFRKILLYRIKSVTFWAEMLSSVPKYSYCKQTTTCILREWISFNSLSFFKIFLLGKTLKLVKTNMTYLRIDKRSALIICELFLLVAIITHFMACTVFAFPRYRKIFTGSFHPKTWLLYNDLIHKQSLSMHYFMAFFKASAQSCGIKIDEYPDVTSWEETMLVIIIYGIGKLIHLVAWMAILHVLVSKDSQYTKFQEIISQLRRWMENLELPLGLQKRVLSYYEFYYRRSYFSKKRIQTLIPDSLENKIRINMCKVLKNCNIKFFYELSDEEIQNIARNLISQIFVPNEMIISCGSTGTALYILASGTVAVYGYSGEEVGHLHDGSFFGEMSLVLKGHKNTTTVIAIETTKIYKLEKVYFEKYIKKNKKLFELFLIQAEESLKQIKRAEEAYRNTLFKRKYSGSKSHIV